MIDVMNRNVALVGCGILLSMLLNAGYVALSLWANPSSELNTSIWLGLSMGAIHSLLWVVPSFSVGYLAKENGFLLGALVAFLGSCAFAVAQAYWFNPQGVPVSILGTIVVRSLLLAIGPAIIGSVSGAAGQLAGTRVAL